MPTQTHRFKVTVNCNLPCEEECTDKLQAFEELYEDYGVIQLPEGYSDTEKPLRLVICCHGGGGNVTANDSALEQTLFAKYLLANGYAVMDVNGLPEEYAHKNQINLCTNIGSPIAVRCYVKAYRYCMENFNLLPEVFVHGSSMGGISSTNLVLSGLIPVLAHSAFCPVLDTYNEIFLHPWGKGAPKFALGKIYGLELDENGEYIYDESKVAGYNPAVNKKVLSYPVPVKFWHCKDDETVAYEVTERFIKNIRRSGGMAHLRSLPYGRHSQIVGGFVEKPCGNTVLDGEKLDITLVAEEAFIWIRNFS